MLMHIVIILFLFLLFHFLSLYNRIVQFIIWFQNTTLRSHLLLRILQIKCKYLAIDLCVEVSSEKISLHTSCLHDDKYVQQKPINKYMLMATINRWRWLLVTKTEEILRERKNTPKRSSTWINFVWFIYCVFFFFMPLQIDKVTEIVELYRV